MPSFRKNIILTISIWLLAVIPFAARTMAASENSATLFAQPDYRFTITSWKIEPIKEKKKRQISLQIAYEIPAKSYFILSVSGSMNQSWPTAFTDEVLRGSEKGEVLLEFEADASVNFFYVTLWRGLGDGPSGIDCDGAIISFPLTVRSTWKHD
jgi:hypothetical protein